VLHYPGGDVVTSDRAVAAIQTPTGPGLAVPLDPSHALLLSHNIERAVTRYDGATWQAVADHVDLGAEDRPHLRSALDRGHEKLPSGGHLIPHPSGRVLTVWCSCTVDCREDVYEERKDSGGAHRFV